jgi:hypothetical protein
MELSPEITKALEVIDAKIAQLNQAKAVLLEAFSGSRTDEVRPKPQKTSSKGRPDRFGQLMKFLTTHGPAKRKDILAHSGIPEGTVAYLLNTFQNFIQLPDGRWAIRDVSTPDTQPGPKSMGGQIAKSA